MPIHSLVQGVTLFIILAPFAGSRSEMFFALCIAHPISHALNLKILAPILPVIFP